VAWKENAMSIFKWNTEEGETLERQIPEAAPRPAIPSTRLPQEHVAAMDDLADYVSVAEQVGFIPPDLGVEAFKAFLVRHDLPVFALDVVIPYMDNRAAKDGPEGAGWQWRPLRERDHRSMAFGRACERPNGNYTPPRLGKPASDYYNGPGIVHNSYYTNPAGSGNHEWREHTFDRKSDQTAYDKTVPIHALKKIALIETGFKAGDVAFFVSDYALLPAVMYPDPFLMAVIPNTRVSSGIGRFVIDFWEEPGFGIDRMVR
jgi:hypothetical protein